MLPHVPKRTAVSEQSGADFCLNTGIARGALKTPVPEAHPQNPNLVVLRNSVTAEGYPSRHIHCMFVILLQFNFMMVDSSRVSYSKKIFLQMVGKGRGEGMTAR